MANTQPMYQAVRIPGHTPFHVLTTTACSDSTFRNSYWHVYLSEVLGLEGTFHSLTLCGIYRNFIQLASSS